MSEPVDTPESDNNSANNLPESSEPGGAAPDTTGVPASHKPSRKDRLRPTELLIFSAVLALFTGLVAFLATREIILALIGFGVAFIISLVVLAMFSLTFKPNPDELTDIEEQDRGH